MKKRMTNLSTEALHQPLVEFIGKMLDDLCIGACYIYNTAKMSDHTYAKFIRGEGNTSARDRILVACIVLIRDTYKEGIINKKECDQLICGLKQVGGSVVIVADRKSTSDLKAYLKQAYEESIHRFCKNIKINSKHIFKK